MNIVPYGDHALLIKFENKIDFEVNQKVISLSNFLIETSPNGFRYCIPAYCSLTVVYDPLVTNFAKLRSKIESIDIKNEKKNVIKSRIINIPVCYQKNYAPDLETFARSKSKSVEEIISLHSSKLYHVYMLGFLPGFAYLGKTDESIKAERRASPRLKVPAGSVGLAGLQTAIYPYESPGGWQLIGKTPIKPFNEVKENPFLFQVGDQVKFREIGADEYKAIEIDIIVNKFDTESLIDVGN